MPIIACTNRRIDARQYLPALPEVSDGNTTIGQIDEAPCEWPGNMAEHVDTAAYEHGDYTRAEGAAYEPGDGSLWIVKGGEWIEQGAQEAPRRPLEVRPMVNTDMERAISVIGALVIKESVMNLPSGMNSSPAEIRWLAKAGNKDAEYIVRQANADIHEAIKFAGESE